jgi:hydrogenase nickel incorporation protein HypA/HybF
MHELGIAQRILEVALARAAAAGATRITGLQLEIGEDSDVSASAIELYWPAVSRGTPAEGARLAFASAADPRAFDLRSIDVP